MAYSKRVLLDGITFSASRHGKENDVLNIKCSDGRTRQCDMTFLPQETANNLMRKLLAAREKHSPVVFESFGNWSVDQWFCDIHVDPSAYLDEYAIFINHSDNVEKVMEIRKALQVGLKALDFRTLAYKHKRPFKLITVVQPLEDAVANHLFHNEVHVIRIDPDYQARRKDFTAFAVYHELQHAVQTHTDRLTYVNGKAFWDDEEVCKETVEYKDLPWEIDANQVAEILAATL